MNTEQLESLRKLANAIEECEMQGVTFSIGDRNVEMFYGKRGVWFDLGSLSASAMRRTISYFLKGQDK